MLSWPHLRRIDAEDTDTFRLASQAYDDRVTVYYPRNNAHCTGRGADGRKRRSIRADVETE